VQTHRTSLTREAAISLYAAAGVPLKQRIAARSQTIHTVAFNPGGFHRNGTRLLTAGVAGVRVWDVAAAHQESRRSTADSRSEAVGIVRGRATAVSSTGRVWDVAAGRVTTTLTAPSATEMLVAFCPDGTTVATGDDGTVRLRDTSTRYARTTFIGLTGAAETLAFSSAGRTPQHLQGRSPRPHRTGRIPVPAGPDDRPGVPEHHMPMNWATRSPAALPGCGVPPHPLFDCLGRTHVRRRNGAAVGGGGGGTVRSNSCQPRSPVTVFRERVWSRVRAVQDGTVVGNLPVVTTSFVGRESELDAVKKALTRHRSVTLTGGGGVGKSRLALRVAEEVRGRYADGVWWVDLSHLYDDRLFTATVCDAVDLLDHNPRAPVEALCEWLTGRQVLLVFDCCERVLPACLLLVSELLAAAPGLTVIATSRQPIGVRDEQRIEVAPLSTDEDGNGDAVRLFHERCASAAPALSLDSPDSAEAVSAICRRLEGIPLALELACARLRENSLTEIAERLGSRLDTLVDDTVWPRRHRALRTAIGWSHELCSPLERLLWARLSVFRGPLDTADARSVCAGGPLSADAIPRLLERLVDQSVLQQVGTRYRMLDTLCEYGAMWLAELGEEQALTRLHAAHFATMVAEAEAGWLSDRQVAWYARISASHADIRAALDHFIEADPDAAVEMAGRTGLFWPCCGHLHESRDYLERTLALDTPQGPSRTRALWALGITLTLQGDHRTALRIGEECAVAANQDGTPQSELFAAHTLGLTHLMAGRPQAAYDVCDHALIAHGTSPPSGAPQLCCMVIRIFAHSALGRLAEAYEAAIALRRLSVRYGEHWARSYAFHQLAFIDLVQGRAHDAERYARAMLTSKHNLNDNLGIALALDLLTGANAMQGNGIAAARTSGTGNTFWRMLGHPNHGTPELSAVRDEWELQARKAVGDNAYDKAFHNALNDDAELGLALVMQGPLPS
jgi:predicted ATPase